MVDIAQNIQKYCSLLDFFALRPAFQQLNGELFHKIIEIFLLSSSRAISASCGLLPLILQCGLLKWIRLSGNLPEDTAWSIVPHALFE